MKDDFNTDQNEEQRVRPATQVVPAVATQDGAGVVIQRAIGLGPVSIVDPFLMLDEIRSENADDYIAGFPPHPHRGFDTVTYMVDGKMRHKDSFGNEGVISSGGVQWMRAARGVIHSETPEQEEGPLWGYQLWVNLPAARKMMRPDYADIDAASIPVVELENGGLMRVIAGTPRDGVTGPLVNEYVDLLFLDITLTPDSAFRLPLTAARNAFAYISQGRACFSGDRQQVGERSTVVFGHGDTISIETRNESVRLLLIAGRPLNEPVARHGPFVMNTRQEIEQALRDYSDGTLAS